MGEGSTGQPGDGRTEGVRVVGGSGGVRSPPTSTTDRPASSRVDTVVGETALLPYWPPRARPVRRIASPLPTDGDSETVPSMADASLSVSGFEVE
jgi:hypothetical protein